MGLIATDTGGGDFELTPAGNHVARCYPVVDLGMQTTTFNGQDSEKRKVRISWELPAELMEDGRPFSVSANYTLSLSEKANLRKDLQSWRGRAFTDEELAGFDLFSVLGIPAMVNVVHNTNNNKTYANVGSVSPMPKGMAAPTLVNDPLKFSLDEYDEVTFQGLPEWLRNKINIKGVQSPQESSDENLPPVESYDDDDPPF